MSSGREDLVRIGEQLFDQFNKPGSATRAFADWKSRGPHNPPGFVCDAVDASVKVSADAVKNLDPAMRKRFQSGD